MQSKHYQSLSGGITMIGIGLLFLIPGLSFWPWILVVAGAASLPASLAANKGWVGWQSFFWMVGLAVLFWSGYFWPGILILAGLSALIGGLMKRDVAPEGPVVEAARASSMPTRETDISINTKRLEDNEVVPASDDELDPIFEMDKPFSKEPESPE